LCNFPISQLLIVALAIAILAYKRIDRENAALIVLDIQAGLFQIVHDMDPVVYSHNILSHAELAKVFELPVLLSTSAETGSY
jgi:nicotinamidase-related amidase